jgi:hypothetical protein
MSNQLTNTILMVRPVDFVFNDQTAQDNEFQNPLSGQDATALALNEFEYALNILESVGVKVLVLEKDSDLPPMPDAVFPNNWFGTDEMGNVHIFPMKTPNRRVETEQLDQALGMLESAGFDVKGEVNWTEVLDNDAVLEGTGSLILDRAHRLVYAAISDRTQPDAARRFASEMDYELILFHTQSSKGSPYYHTNVVMAIGEKMAVVCLDCIPDATEKALVKTRLSAHHTLIEISIEQLEKGFCGNLLQVLDAENHVVTVMSETAFSHFTEKQMSVFQSFGKVLSIAIPTIEFVGGGSIRCMMAEIFCPKSN